MSSAPYSLQSSVPTLGQVQARRRSLSRQQAESDLGEFVRQGWHVLEPMTPLEWSWHHDAMCQHIQAVLEDWMRVQIARLDMQPEPGDEMHQRAALLGMLDETGRVVRVFRQRAQNVLFNVPPGTMKSLILSVMAPCWMWLRWPEWRALCLSSAPDVAMRDAVKARDILQSDWFLETFTPSWSLADDQNAKGNFKNTRGGVRQSKGFTAKITGSRADALLIDDPHDAKEVKSDPIREAVLERWDSAIGNRVNDLRTSIRIIIMQRLHEKDLSGHVLSKGGVEHLCVPLEYEGKPVCRCVSCQRGETFLGWKDPRKVVGEVIQESRFPPEVVEVEKKRLGSYGAAGQLQQRPAPAAGGMFPRKWWRFHSVGGLSPLRNGAAIARPEGCDTLPPEPTPQSFDRVIFSLDANFKERESSDPASLWVIGTVQARRYVLDRRQAHGFPDTKRMLKDAHAAISQRYRVDAALVEARANGDAIIQELQGTISGIVPREPEGGKTPRAAAMQPSVEAGDWYLLDGADWVEDVVGEFSLFPRGAHDDDVDAASQAHIYLALPQFYFG